MAPHVGGNNNYGTAWSKVSKQSKQGPIRMHDSGRTGIHESTLKRNKCKQILYDAKSATLPQNFTYRHIWELNLSWSNVEGYSGLVPSLPLYLGISLTCTVENRTFHGPVMKATVRVIVTITSSLLLRSSIAGERQDANKTWFTNIDLAAVT